MCMQLVFPRIFSYVVDEPEGKDISCLRGWPSFHPCERCWVHRDQLHDVGAQNDEKTVPGMQQLWDELLSLSTKTARGDFCSQKSFHVVQSGLLGFAGLDTKAGNLYRCFGFDSLHSEDLGVFLYIVDNIKVSSAPPDNCPLFALRGVAAPFFRLSLCPSGLFVPHSLARRNCQE